MSKKRITPKSKVTKFQYFTYFLNPAKQKSIFPDKRDKKEIVRSILSDTIQYESRGVKLAFVMVKQEGDYIFAKLGKKASLKRNLPPQRKFEEMREESWPHCIVAFNISDDPNTGQRIVFEVKPYIFSSPYGQLKALANELNVKLLPTGYVISINPITVEQKFWDVVKENEDRIEKLSFSFNAPNLFDLKNSLTQELKDLQRDYSMTKATMELENPAGKLKIPENDLTKQGVEYISKGGGEYRLAIRGIGRHIISSRKKNIKTRTFEGIDLNITTKDRTLIKDVLNRLFE